MLPEFHKPIRDYNYTDLIRAFTFSCMLYAVWILIMDLVTPQSPSPWVKSGVVIIVDPMTKVEYIKTPEGFITPRLGIK